MAAVMFIIAAIVFAVATFGGNIGSISLVPFGLMFLAVGHLLGGVTIPWRKG